MKRFTLIEFMVVLAIIAILFAMILPAIYMASRKQVRHKFHEKYNDAIPRETTNKIIRFTIFDEGQKNIDLYKEFEQVAKGKTELKKSKLLAPYLKDYIEETKEVQEITGDTYERWVTFTGNPRKLTKQEFDILAEKDLIPELKYSNWRYATGNPKDFTEEQFNALKSKGLITFDKK